MEIMVLDIASTAPLFSPRANRLDPLQRKGMRDVHKNINCQEKKFLIENSHAEESPH
jgi:hypothetical protein